MDAHSAAQCRIDLSGEQVHVAVEDAGGARWERAGQRDVEERFIERDHARAARDHENGKQKRPAHVLLSNT